MKNRMVLLFTLLIVQLLMISTVINAVNVNSNSINTDDTKIIEFDKHYSHPTISKNGNFLNVYLDEGNSYLKTPGEPILPSYLETFELPLGAKIKKIEFVHSEINEIKISNDIIPAAKTAVSYDIITNEINEKNYYVYNTDMFYPNNWYQTKVVGGLNRCKEHTTFLTLQINPVRYNPVNKCIQFIEFTDFRIIYEEPSLPISFGDEYDLLILSYDFYTPFLKPLVSHKTNHNVRTKLVSLKEVYKSTGSEGKDKPEQIKYFIKNAIEEWGIKYVMLVGNFRKFPVRDTHLETDKGGTFEELDFACDLYYADVYDSEGNFSSWDTDNDGIHGEWPYTSSMQDDVDLAPDVYVGRLACRNIIEVKKMVEKIIVYENNTYGSDWFNTMIVIGGDTFEKSIEGGTDYNEGEEVNEKALEYMHDYNHVKIYTSLGNLTTQNIHNEISKGAGFVYFAGHGNPRHWTTHKNGDYENWTEGFANRDMPKLTNEGMYPILMVGGCHNSNFETTPINFVKGFLTEGLSYFLGDDQGFGSYYLYDWVPECWSWVFVKVNNGGAIASIGSVGYGGVEVGDYNHNDIPDCVEGLDGWFETQFFRLYNEEEIDVLGDVYYQTVTNYINEFPVFSNRYDCKILETHELLGDPSLRIGGYE